MAVVEAKKKKKYYFPQKTYEKYCEAFEKMDTKAGEYVPSMENMRNDILPNLKQNMAFLLWIDETGVVTNTNREMHRYIKDIIQENLDIVV